MSNQPPYGQQPQQPQQPGYPPQQPYGQQPGYPPQQPYGYPPQPQKRGGCLKFGIIGVVVVLLLCGVGGFFLYRFTMGELNNANATLDGFMKAGAANDVNAAKTFVDGNVITEDQITELFSQRELFEGYTSVADLPNNTNANSSTGQDATLNIEGAVNYSDGTGTYDVQLTRVGSDWKIRFINIRRN